MICPRCNTILLARKKLKFAGIVNGLGKFRQFALNCKGPDMGYSTPKTPFDLTKFLDQKAAPRSYRKPVWARKSIVKLSTAHDTSTGDGGESGPEGKMDS
jgi:hypothetical protein